MTRLRSVNAPVSKRAPGATSGIRPEGPRQPPVRDFARIEAVESRSILGAHDGILPDDVMDLLEDDTIPVSSVRGK